MTMDLLSLTVGLPLAPLRGVLAVAQLLQNEAESELYDPSRVRRELEEVEAAQANDQIPDDTAEERRRRSVSRLIQE
ncbi:MAG TPA: gas vesicle protein GvpG [Micromonosporaceae bacterium]|jgi:hypothetical protein